MANDNLMLSEAGIAKLKKAEGVIDGLYDDSSGYCTSGVGHLVHQREKWKCFLLEAASADDAWKKYVLKQRPGKSKSYLARPTAFDNRFAELKTKAIDISKAVIAQKKYKKAFDKLTRQEQEKVTAAASSAVDEQAKLLAKMPNDVLKEDIKPFEKAVRAHITAKLTQEEFDALFSFCFNIGRSAFSKSSVVKEINKNNYKSGTVKERRAAIQAIENAFLKFNKSHGVVNDGLTKRRKAEADQFLAAARAELVELEKKAPLASGSRPSVGSPNGGPAGLVDQRILLP